MKWLATIILITLVNITFLSFGLFQHAGNHDVGPQVVDCLADVFENTICPEVTNVMSMVSHHFSAFQSFSEGLASIGVTTMVALLFLISSAGLIVALVKLFNLLENFSILYQRFRRRQEQKPRRNSEITHWLSLFELSPSY